MPTGIVAKMMSQANRSSGVVARRVRSVDEERARRSAPSRASRRRGGRRAVPTCRPDEEREVEALGLRTAG